jgi:hypothetical protein
VQNENEYRQCGGDEMTKKTFSNSNISAAGREANKHFKNTEAAKALTDNEKAQEAFHKNRERLKAERLARDVAKAKGND